MRAISSSIALAEALQQELAIFWIQDDKLNSPFSALFEPIEGIRLIECKRVPLVFRTAQKRNLFLPALIRKFSGGQFYDTTTIYELSKKEYNFLNFNQYKTIFITSCVSFFQNQATYKSFQPTAHIREKIDLETQFFNQYTLGVHVRRTDNKQASLYSPLRLFIDAIEQEIERQPLANFYLASDDADVKLKLLNRFGDRIITNCEPVTRATTEGMQRAVVELFSLARTQQVLGSYWSSFSQTACDISGIPEITLRTV